MIQLGISKINTYFAFDTKLTFGRYVIKRKVLGRNFLRNGG